MLNNENISWKCLDSVEEEKPEKQLDVYLRLKGGVNYGNLYEIPDSNTLISIIPEGSESTRNNKHGDVIKRKYNFSKVFGSDTKQSEIFNELVKQKILKFLNGDDSTLMTYGVSGSGKTYTIIGTNLEPGVLPRSLEYIFQTLPSVPENPCIKPDPKEGVVVLTQKEIAKEIQIKTQILNFKFPNVDQPEHTKTYESMQSYLQNISGAFLDEVTDVSIDVWVSHAEIYNEHIYDLLELEKGNKKSRTKLKLCNSNSSTYIKHLTYVHVSSGMEAYLVLQYGLHHLNYAKTNINEHSSRSHSIFSVILTQKNTNNEFCVSKFNFCDLAGAERSKKTLNVGTRLKESNNINTSLLVLGRCIAGVRNNQSTASNHLIPFRESKLTQIFQKALLGQEDISMIVNINPSYRFFDETQHVLNFSAIAKEIIVKTQDQKLIRKAKRVSQNFQEAANAVHHDEARINDLKKQISEYCILIEEEETDAQMEMNLMRQELLVEHHNVFESTEKRLETQYSELEKKLDDEYRQKLREAKLALREEYSEFSISSDSSDEETNYSQRKRKHSSDVETITILSSDEEEYKNLCQRKLELQTARNEEHHKTISVLGAEIMKIRAKNEELMKIISEKEAALKT